MLYIVDHTVFEHFLARNGYYTHAALKRLIEYMHIVGVEVDRIVNDQLRPNNFTILVNPIAVYIAQVRFVGVSWNILRCEIY